MRRTTPQGIAVQVALCATLAAVAFHGCSGDSEPGDGGADEDSYVRCTETMCVAGDSICCAGAAPGTWDAMRLGCICPSSPDADADGDGDDTTDVEPDVDLDVEADVEPDTTADVDPDATPDVDPDAAPDVEPDATAEAD